MERKFDAKYNFWLPSNREVLFLNTLNFAREYMHDTS
jgi:hypothetical protein